MASKTYGERAREGKAKKPVVEVEVRVPHIEISKADGLTVAEVEKLLQEKAEANGQQAVVGIKGAIKAVLPVLSSITKPDIDPERIKKRAYICSECPLLGIRDQSPACTICGCKLRGTDKAVVNLVAKEKPGCKFPTGSLWEKHGV